MADTSKSAAAGSPPGTGGQPDPLLGRTINERFRIISTIARGGMGKVYKAEQAPLGRICAVKVLNPNYAGDNDPEFHKRFFLEASIASKLSHPNTVTIFDYGKTDDEIYYMAMEYLEGRTLHRLIRDEAPLDPLRAVHITRQICRSLREAHGLGVIHRDLKPANIYLIAHDEESDFVKVLDFGLVKNVEDTAESLTQTGLFMGSPKYMAPEQIRGERVTARTDVYALGVVMFEMLTGKVPFDRGNSVNTLMAHVSEPVPLMRDLAPAAIIPSAIEDVVYRCLLKRAEERYASMDELLAALKHAAGVASGEHSLTGEYGSAGSRASAEIAPRGASVPPQDSGPEPGITSGLHATPAKRTSVPAQKHSTRPADPTTGGPDATNTPLAMSSTLDEPAKKSRSGLLFGAIALAGLAVGGYFVFFDKAPTATAGATSPSVPAVTERAADPLAPAPSPVAIRSVHVALDSTPPNAEVLEGTASLGHTPLHTEWTGEQADPARAHTFTFRLAGHRDATITLAGATLEHTAQLVADASAAETAAPAPGTRPAIRPTARPAGHPRTGTRSPSGTRQNPPAGYRGIDDW